MNHSDKWTGEEWELISKFFIEGKAQLDKLIVGIGDPNEFVTLVTALKGTPITKNLSCYLL